MVTYLKTLSLKVRLTILFVAVFGVTTGVFSGFMYYLLRDSLLEDFDGALYNFSIDVSKAIETDDSRDLLFPVISVDDEKIFPFSFKNPLILIRHSSGGVISQSENTRELHVPFRSEQTQILNGADSSYTQLEVPGADVPYRMITFPLGVAEPAQFFLQIAVPMTRYTNQLGRLQLILGTGFPVLLLLAVFLGLYFSSRALRPLQDLITSTEKVGIKNLSGRVPLPQARDEIRRLAETQNSMLDRIEKAFQSQERFVADASHQLLTPLTILRGEIETRHRDQSLLQEVDNLTQIVKDMLILARVDAGSDQMNFRPLDVDEILLDVISSCQKIAKAKDVTIKVDIRQLAEKKPVEGDTDLLYNLFFNLIENAVKYSDKVHPVTVTMTWSQNETSVDIINSGAGIPAGQRTSVFERFSRVAQGQQKPGFGLGLSIAKKIADLHGFDLLLLEDPFPQPSPGAHFQLRMKSGDGS